MLQKIQSLIIETVDTLQEQVPTPLKITMFLRAMGLAKIPLLFAVRPTVTEIDDDTAIVRIKLNRTTKNHLGSMYFGTLAIGADCVVGMLAYYHMRKIGNKGIHLSFKSFQADFLKRPDADVFFLCEAGAEIEEFVKKVANSHERHNLEIPAKAVTRKNGKEEVVAAFRLTLSLKKKD